MLAGDMGGGEGMESIKDSLPEKYKKPPLGTCPSWYAIPKRIQGLSDAISRFTGHDSIGKDKEVTMAIREWAVEIICHCNTLDKLQDFRGKQEDGD